MSKLLVVDRDPLQCENVRRLLAASDVEVISAHRATDGWRKLAERPDVVVLDLDLPDGAGLDQFDRLHAADPHRPIILTSAHATPDTAIEAMKRGAFEYLRKPLDDDRTSRILERAFEAAHSRQDAGALIEPEPGQIIGQTPAIHEMCKQIGRVAALDIPVLIVGESGVGKGVVARAIHQHSSRSGKPFIAVNCAAASESLIEGELFGHENPIEAPAIGKFEQCEDGTILVDEIGDLPASAQARLLRVLKEGRFERVGGSRPIATRARLLVASNFPPEQLIATGRLRADLYYRLKEATIRVPPLREHKGDIPELARFFLGEIARATGCGVRDFTEETLEILQRYSWPGNIRELRSTIKEAVSATTGHAVLPESLPPILIEAAAVPKQGAFGRLDIHQALETMLESGEKDLFHRVMGPVERMLIARVLRHTHGHQSQASELLGIDRKTLRYKLRDMGIVLDRIVTDRSHGTNGTNGTNGHGNGNGNGVFEPTASRNGPFSPAMGKNSPL